jgi:O-antigen/teichoic acid export membrane protein
LQIINKYIKSEFLKNILTLFTGASIAQLIPIIASPILSRIYAPEQFGELGILMSVVGIFSMLATFQYEAAIMLPKKDEDAFNLLVIAAIITVFISILSFCITSIFHLQIANLLDYESFSEWVYLIPFFVLLNGFFNSLNIWTSRKKQYKRLAFRQIAQTTVGAGVKLILGWMKYLNSGLIWGTIAGQITSTGVLAAKTIKDSRKLFSSVSFERIKKNAIEYQDFPKYTMWQGFLDLVNASGVIFILSSFYGVAVVGLYSFTIALLQKPTQMIGQAVSQVFYQNASNKVANNLSIYNDTIRLIRNLALIGGIIFLPILLFAPYLFSFVFGEKWRDAGVIAQIIAPWFFLRFIASPLANLAMILKKQKVFLFITIGMNIIMPAIFFIVGVLNMNYKYAFIISSSFMVLYLIGTIKWALSFTKDKFINLKQRL